MPTIASPFNAESIEQIRLELLAEKNAGKNPGYKVQIDDKVIIDRTSDLDRFYDFEDFLTPDNRWVKIIVFHNASYNKNKHYHFSLNARHHRQAFEEVLGNLSDDDYSEKELRQVYEQRKARVMESEDVKRLMQQAEEMTRRENQLKENLSVKEKEVERLMNALEIANSQRNTYNGINLGEVLVDAGEELFRRKAHLLMKDSWLAPFAKLFGVGNKTGEQKQGPLNDAPPTESDFNFKRKEENQASPALSEEEKYILEVFAQFRNHYEREEMIQLFEILDFLYRDKGKLATIHSLANGK